MVLGEALFLSSEVPLQTETEMGNGRGCHGTGGGAYILIYDAYTKSISFIHDAHMKSISVIY